ncbi:MAG TPA: GtrA family protein [Spirochaetota bacterium]|nr:GtrA family protein [Spirochaetota bacterium]HPP03458.1 GtrA family protein [Spirochaetota bacterium]
MSNFVKFLIKTVKYFLNIQFVRYLINGAFLFVIDFIIFYFFNKIIGFKVYFCQAISRTCSAFIGFWTHKYFVFKNKENDLLKFSLQGILFIGLIFFNIFFSSFVVYFLYYIIKVKNILLLKILTETIVVTESYLSLNLIFWKSKKNR